MTADITSWLAGRLPDDWFEGAPEITIDRDEILIVGTLARPQNDDTGDAATGRIARWREDTRAQRVTIAREAQGRFERTISWGARCGETRQLFTTLSTPVMTRLRQPERRVLDTLVDSGVARSRSHALAWCVRLVGEHSEDWLSNLREAMLEVERVRERGPDTPTAKAS